MVYIYVILKIKKKEREINKIFRTKVTRVSAENGIRASKVLVTPYFLGWVGGTWVLILLFLIT